MKHTTLASSSTNHRTLNFKYDALGRRIQEGPITRGGSTTLEETTVELFYSSNPSTGSGLGGWRVSHERKEVESVGRSRGASSAGRWPH